MDGWLEWMVKMLHVEKNMISLEYKYGFVSEPVIESSVGICSKIMMNVGIEETILCWHRN